MVHSTPSCRVTYKPSQFDQGRCYQYSIFQSLQFKLWQEARDRWKRNLYWLHWKTHLSLENEVNSYGNGSWHWLGRSWQAEIDDLEGSKLELRKFNQREVEEQRKRIMYFCVRRHSFKWKEGWARHLKLVQIQRNRKEPTSRRRLVCKEGQRVLKRTVPK